MSFWDSYWAVVPRGEPGLRVVTTCQVMIKDRDGLDWMQLLF